MPEFTLLQKILLWAIPLLFAITVHETAHGWVASKLGDKTAYFLGRLSINPFKHVDLVGTIIVPSILFMLGGFIFGWAKPVPINWENLKNPRRDMALVALAGPLANLAMAISWALIMKLGVMSEILPLIFMGAIGININLVLMVLNLIPIPPLDGSRVISCMLPARFAFSYRKLESVGFFILLALLATGALGHVLMPFVHGLKYIIVNLFHLNMVGF